MSRPLISIVTLNWNRKDDVLRTLKSISGQTYRKKEILVVDNGSKDDSVAAIRNAFPQVGVLDLGKNLGVAGYNEGMKIVSGEYLMLLDNDMELLQNDTLEKIVGYFEADPKLGAAAMQVRDHTGTTLSPNNPKYWKEQGDEEHGYPCSTFDGGGVALRKGVLDQVGLYLPQFFVYHSEVDLSTRIWDAGYEIRYFPQVAVWHHESPVSRNPALHTFYATRNYLWYVWIYYPASLAVRESLHFLQRSFLQTRRAKRPVASWAKGVCSALYHWPRLGVRRNPARKATIEWMQKLREMDHERKMQESAQSS
jgi:GT2 family glycosyltransferase